MNAWRVDATKGIEALSCAEADEPVPKPGEVLIDVHACGLNFSDLLMAQGKYQVRPPLPFVPGQEIAGRIGAVAAGSLRKVGERVASKVLWGGFAERAVAREDMLVTLPDSMSYSAGATLPVVWPKAWIALFERARLVAGETLLVHAAAGGVGLAAVQLARAAGATVIAGVGDAAKSQVVLEAGATHAVVTRHADWPARVAELTGGQGPSVIFDPVGGEIAETSLKVIARNGRFLVVGFASGEIPRLAANRLLLKNASAQSKLRGVLAPVEHETIASLSMALQPAKFSGSQGVSPSREPGLGEHTAEVLGGLLGLDAAAIQVLRDTGAI